MSKTNLRIPFLADQAELRAHDERMAHGCSCCGSAAPMRLCPDCFVCIACSESCEHCAELKKAG